MEAATLVVTSGVKRLSCHGVGSRTMMASRQRTDAPAWQVRRTFRSRYAPPRACRSITDTHGRNRNVRLLGWPSIWCGNGKVAQRTSMTARTARSAKAWNNGSDNLPLSSSATLAIRVVPLASVTTVSTTLNLSTPSAPASLVQHSRTCAPISPRARRAQGIGVIAGRVAAAVRLPAGPRVRVGARRLLLRFHLPQAQQRRVHRVAVRGHVLGRVRLRGLARRRRRGLFPRRRHAAA